MGWVTKTLSSRAPPWFGRQVKPLVPAAFAVVSTHQSALGPRGGLWPVLLVVNPLRLRKACASAVGTLIGWWLWWWWIYEYMNINGMVMVSYEGWRWRSFRVGWSSHGDLTIYQTVLCFRRNFKLLVLFRGRAYNIGNRLLLLIITKAKI
jgi:hypothetical protein